MLERPNAAEYAPFFAGYVARVPETDVLGVLRSQPAELAALAEKVPIEREGYRYEPGKWSIRELFGHLIDAERVFGYRAFCISRGDQNPLPGFDEKDYIASSGYDRRNLADLVREFSAVREASLAVLRWLRNEDWTRAGTANASPVTVRALAFIMAGHVRHHVVVLASRYGVSGQA